MKKVLFDTNVILDVLLDRQPHARASAAAWNAVEHGQVEGFVAAHAVTTIHYLVSREIGAIRSKRVVAALLTVFRVAAVDGPVIQQAFRISGHDVEDAVTAVAAEFSSCELIVTRDPQGFRGSPVRHIPPEALLAILSEE